MKKNIYMRIGVLMLIAALATSGVFVGSGTYAKYIAAAEVNASARVAKFQVQYGATTSGTFTNFSQASAAPVVIQASGPLGTLLQPASSYADHPIYNASTNPTGTIVGVTGNKTIIAPGTGGKIGFYFTNLSEVAVRFYLDPSCTVSFGSATTRLNSETAKEIEFAPAGASGAVPTTGWGSLVDALGDATTAGKYIDLPPNTTTASAANCRFVYWRWVFEASRDARDTALGVAAVSADVPMDLTVKFTAQQID